MNFITPNKAIGVIVQAIILFNLNCSLFAQSVEDDVSLVHYKNRIILSPVNFFDPFNPSLQIGYERHLNEKISIQIEAAHLTKRSFWGYTITNIFGYSGENLYTFSGYAARGEVKSYFKPKKVLVIFHPYVSGELFYRYSYSNVQDLFLDKELVENSPNIPYSYTGYKDYFEIEKKKVGLNAKLGVQIDLAGHLNIEAYFGIGIAYRNSVHFDRNDPGDEFLDDGLSNQNFPGISWLPSIPANIKLGYRF